MPDIGIFGLEFVKMQILPYEKSICLMTKYFEKKKCLNWGLKMPYLGFLGVEF